MFEAAARQNENRPKYTAEWLKNNGYSQDFINIFITEQYGSWDFVDGNKRNGNLHDYMLKYNQGVTYAALNEFRNDFK